VAVIDNSEAYHNLGWVLDNADKGFFVAVAPHHMQGEIAKRFTSRRVGTFDYSLDGWSYSYDELIAGVDALPEDIDVILILNMQIALRDDTSMVAFNMSRDMLARKHKIWLFFMDKETEYRMSTIARDVYSFVRQKIYFEAEADEDFDGQDLQKFDARFNWREIKAVLERNRELEERYMALDLDKTPTNQLLSAAIALTNFAELYKDCGEYDNAIRLLEKIKDIRVKCLGEEHPDTSITYNDIAVIYSNMGLHDQALKWYSKVLDVAEKVLGSSHPEMALRLSNVAVTYKRQNNYTKAMESNMKDLIISENALGTSHPLTARIYNGIADTHRRLGNYDDALNWGQLALEIYEKALGEKHPDTALVCSVIAATYSSEKEYAKALDWYMRALVVYEKVRGIEHPDTAKTYISTATVYLLQGDYTRALKWSEKAREAYLHIYGDTRPMPTELSAIIERARSALNK